MFENDYAFYGKHASYIKFLSKKDKEDRDDDTDLVVRADIFERYIDVYMNAAIWGLLYGRTAKRDKGTDRARIYADTFSRERDNCVFLYRMVMLLDKTENVSADEKVERAFRYDAEPDKKELFKNNMELFHDYIRGGIEIMYERFTDGCITRDDYLNKTYEVLVTFKKEIEGISYEDELVKLIKN